MNRHFVLSSGNEAQRGSYKWYYLPTKEINDYSVMTDGKNFFDQPVINDLTIK